MERERKFNIWIWTVFLPETVGNRRYQRRESVYVCARERREKKGRGKESKWKTFLLNGKFDLFLVTVKAEKFKLKPKV